MNISRMYSLYDAFSERSLPKLQRKLADVQERLATGRRINRPSDDPQAYALAGSLEALGERYEQYQHNIDHSRTWLTQVELALEGLGELVQKGRQMALRATNSNYQAEDLQRMAQQVEKMIDDAVGFLNTQHGSTGEYLFAGTNNTSKPFSLDANNDVTYNGNTSSPERRIGKNTTVPVSIDGNQLITVDGSGVDLIDRLENLREALASDDDTGLRTSLEELKEAHDHIVGLTAKIGHRGSRLDVAERQLQDVSLTVRGRRSKLEDTNYTKTLIDLQRLQTSYQASLKVTSTILKRSSLVDYL